MGNLNAKVRNGRKREIDINLRLESRNEGEENLVQTAQMLPEPGFKISKMMMDMEKTKRKREKPHRFYKKSINDSGMQFYNVKLVHVSCVEATIVHEYVTSE